VDAAADPLADDVVAFGDEVRGSAEREVRECRPEVGCELPYRGAAAERPMQRVFKADVGVGELVDDRGVEVGSPEVREPPSDDRLVFLYRYEAPFG